MPISDTMECLMLYIEGLRHNMPVDSWNAPIEWAISRLSQYFPLSTDAIATLQLPIPVMDGWYRDPYTLRWYNGNWTRFTCNVDFGPMWMNDPMQMETTLVPNSVRSLCNISLL